MPVQVRTHALSRDDVRQSARLVALLRILVVVLSWGLWAMQRQRNVNVGEFWQLALQYQEWLLIAVTASSLVMLGTVRWVLKRWQLIFHLVFDLVWVGIVIYLTGGVSGPGPVLLFAVILTATLVLPGAQCPLSFPW